MQLKTTKIKLLTSPQDHCNIIGIVENFWSEEYIEEVLNKIISWRPVNVKYGRREVANLITQNSLNVEIVQCLRSFNKNTYRIPDLKNCTITSSIYRYSEPGHKYDWHQDAIFNLQMLKNWERIRRYSAIIPLNDSNEYTGGDLLMEGFPTPIQVNKGDLLMFTSIHKHKVTPLISGERLSYCMWLESRHHAHSLNVE
jgi:predicted 2-oxoglutarate/Fe(II)-dependent dioxygenase YbiX